MPVARLSQTDIFYVDQGAGKPLVLIHGLGVDYRLWAPQIETFSRTHRVISPDVRGNGESGRLTGPIKTVLDRQCDDIAVLLDRLDIDRVALCGESYGGVFAFHFVLRHPDRVAALIAVDSFGDTRPRNWREALIIAANYNIQAYYLPRSWLAAAIRWQYARWPEAVAYLVPAMRRLRRREVVLQRLAINLAEHTSQLNRVRCPALGLVGDFSGIAVDLMRRAVGAIPNSRLEIIPGSFDPSNLIATTTFDRLLHEFLAEVGW